MAAEKTVKIQSFQGLISAPFTAFTPNGEVNAEIIPKYVEHLVKQGVKGVFVNGTTGEGLSLTVSERKTIAEGWVKYGKNKLDLVIIHIGANSMKDAEELFNDGSTTMAFNDFGIEALQSLDSNHCTKFHDNGSIPSRAMASHAEKIGASGIASLPPLFYKPQTLDHLVEYFKKIAQAAPTLPLMLYHIPAYSSVEICLGEFLPKVREAVPTFCGAKFTSTEVRDLLRCHALQGNHFKLLSGYDEVLLPCLASGVTAAVGATYNFMAPLSLRILEAFKKENMEVARKYQNRVLYIVEKICRHGQGIACLKATMNLLGPLDFGSPRVPLVPLDPESLDNLKEDLKNLQTAEWSRI